MRFTNVNLGRSDILGRKTLSPSTNVGMADVAKWRRNLGYLSIFAGVTAIISSQSGTAIAKDADLPRTQSVPPHVAALAKKIGSACSKPELLRRQSEYRLPSQKGEFNMLAVLTGGDNCPGTAIPNGTYTAAAPFADSGTTAGANNTVGTARVDATNPCIEGYAAFYSSALAPDHIYTFTLSARGANPRITVDGAGTYDVSTYILSNNGTACPAGTGNVAQNCLVGTDVNFDGNPEIIDSVKMNSLPLGVPLYLFVDSFYAAATPSTTNNGAYTVSMQDVTVGSGPTPPSNDAPVDINGDGKTDFVTVRNTGGGTGGQITWYKSFQDGQPTTTTDWGIASDQFIPADFDGDGRDDYAVFRPGTVGRFYIVQSTTSTMRIEDFGTTGDDATVVGDYNGDNEDDIAVFRVGPNPGDPATWYYRPRSQPVFTQVAWGQNGDTPAPGDYDGDGKYDFVVQRADSNGVNGRFWVRTATGAQSSQFFGLKTDAVVPGDYDDDGKTDFAVVRDDGGSIRWTFEPSGTAGVTEVTDVWGNSATDFVVQGDYDGDGRTDYAVWRPGSPGTFYIMTVSRSISSRVWGLTGDYPVANYNQH